MFFDLRTKNESFIFNFNIKTNMVFKALIKKRKDIQWRNLVRTIKDAKKDPEFMKEIKQFIKITTS